MNILSNPVFWQGCVVGIALGIFLCAYVLARNVRQSIAALEAIQAVPRTNTFIPDPAPNPHGEE